MALTARVLSGTVAATGMGIPIGAVLVKGQTALNAGFNEYRPRSEGYRAQARSNYNDFSQYRDASHDYSGRQG